MMTFTAYSLLKTKQKNKRGGSKILGNSYRIPIASSQWNCGGNCFDYLKYENQYTNYRRPIYSSQWLCNGKCFDYASPDD